MRGLKNASQGNHCSKCDNHHKKTEFCFSSLKKYLKLVKTLNGILSHLRNLFQYQNTMFKNIAFHLPMHKI